MFFFDKQKIGLNKRKNDGTLTSYILHITYIIVSPQENDIEEFINLFNNSEKKKRIGIVFIYICIQSSTFLK